MRTTTRRTAWALAGAAASALAGPALAAETTLKIESWRNDDLVVWQTKIIPAFEKAYPDIKLNYQPTAPKEYDAALNSKLDAGTAGDIIACRPFDSSQALFKKGELTSVNDIAGMGDFSAVAKAGWTTDDGATSYCVPVAAVLHGFIYNKDAFAKAGIKDLPKTTDAFFADLDAIKKEGSFVPLSLGTPDQWEAATMGYQNIGPNYWHGEEGREALIAGKQKLTDEAWVAPFKELARWSGYMGEGFKAQSYPDSQNLFTLGRAAIYPAGSWEIAQFQSQAQFPMGVFPPPVPKAGDPCYISDHPDIALGMNAKSKNAAAAKTFLTWVASPDFAKIYANALPGFFSLQTAPVNVDNALAKDFVGFRKDCKSTMRSTYQMLSRGTPNLENETWVESANVINGTDTPEVAAAKLQKGLDSWYKPGK